MFYSHLHAAFHCLQNDKMDVVVVPSEKQLAKTGCTTYVLYLESVFGRSTFTSCTAHILALLAKEAGLNIDNVMQYAVSMQQISKPYQLS